MNERQKITFKVKVRKKRRWSKRKWLEDCEKDLRALGQTEEDNLWQGSLCSCGLSTILTKLKPEAANLEEQQIFLDIL